MFGTDGIRGRTNKSPMTASVTLEVAQACACALIGAKRNHKKPQVVIGKDTRLSGYMFESALTSGFCSMGADVLLVGPIPTPGIAFLTEGMRADAGLVISASHNAFEDNGIKVFGADGFKLSDEIESEITRLYHDKESLRSYLPEPSEVGRASRLVDAYGRYISYLKHHFPRELSLDGIRMVVDCAHGATYKIAPTVFAELGAQVHTIGVSPNGTNINHDFGATHPEVLSKKVLETGAHIGISFDGDGDRVVLCDSKGRVWDGDKILALYAQTFAGTDRINGGVVGTVMSNLSLEHKIKDLGLHFYRASVGDRYVVELMREKKSLLGGEPSGHLLFLDRSTTGDGILSALMVLEILCKTQKSLDEYDSILEKYPQRIRNIDVVEKKPLDEWKELQDLIRHAQGELKDRGRVLVRYSGTENKARVMVEADQESVVNRWVDEISKLFSKDLS
ncbi:MAG: phosphoglucosamine mutase [Bdellovibrionota bacterium]